MTDRIKEALLALIRAAVAKLGYLGTWPCTVLSQDADGLLALRPDSTLLPPLSGVPLFVGLPGTSLRVKPGARVSVVFTGGDPRCPLATVWASAGLDEIRVTATGAVKLRSPEIKLVVHDEIADLLGVEIPDDEAPLARDGDLVELRFLVPTLGITGTVVPTGLALVGTVAIDALTGVIEADPNTATKVTTA